MVMFVVVGKLITHIDGGGGNHIVVIVTQHNLLTRIESTKFGTFFLMINSTKFIGIV